MYIFCVIERRINLHLNSTQNKYIPFMIFVSFSYANSTLIENMLLLWDVDTQKITKTVISNIYM